MSRERLIRRRLRALGVTPPQELNAHFQALVLKLEEEHIRHYAISERRALKDADSKAFVKALLKYCDDVGVEIDDSMLVDGKLTEEGITSVLDGLTLAALEEEYTDLVSGEPATRIPHNLQTRNCMFQQLGAARIAVMTVSPLYKTRSTTSWSYSAYRRCNQTHPCRKFGNENATKLNTVHMNLADVPCGIRSDNAVVTKAARVLRTLHSQELCKLQADIVWLSERFQELTANPVANCHAR
ncbi:hypothetical protein, conserved [Babesia bigemina]|uniref:Uncharacterized protein n=1 Tax=Babesia bigemina TaxID=5866 RepID=A0A061DBV8_BABBI|nr:hypothetical protein, conserved [Babesia bigemina]CDR98063.1 hypothetical protein, conserved [Babesia bigemina]|eukprot:XP_012770249.1 hypothetical protein, conserved [Babesia bigemina]